MFIMKMTPHRAIATMEIHLPAGPVMVLTTFSRGLENSVMPPDAAAMSGKQRQRVRKPKTARRGREELRVGRRVFTRITISVEAVMQRGFGAYSPQDDSALAARTKKLDFSCFYVTFCQKFVALPAAKVAGVVRVFGFHAPCSAFTS